MAQHYRSKNLDQRRGSQTAFIKNARRMAAITMHLAPPHMAATLVPTLQQTHLQPGCLADHFATPGGIPDKIHNYILNTWNIEQFGACLVCNDGAHATAR